MNHEILGKMLEIQESKWDGYVIRRTLPVAQLETMLFLMVMGYTQRGIYKIFTQVSFWHGYMITICCICRARLVRVDGSTRWRQQFMARVSR